MRLCQSTRKTVAASLLAILLTQTLFPAVSYALTSGPTSPEATSFEPVDTTDMVNVQTGDMVYNIPLIEIPGPEGGYPLSLSYHAGMQPNEDASWVGLGWTLNPGAINRSVNGYADDWTTANSNSHVYWEGGHQTDFRVGVSVGIANCTSVMAGLTFSNDTYKGFGIGADIGLQVAGGAKWGGANWGGAAQVDLGVTAYGDPYVSGGVGVGAKSKGGLKASVGIDFTSDFKSLEAGMNGFLGNQYLGMSLSSSSNQPSFTVGGITAHVSNSQASNISTKSTGFNVEIPIYTYLNLQLGYNYQRYWTNETTDVNTRGSLHHMPFLNPGDPTMPVSFDDDVAFDEYSLLEDPSYKNIIEYPDPKVLQGGSFPAFDVYSVSAQGLGGNMRPFQHEGELMNQNIKMNSNQDYVSYFTPRKDHFAPYFRFENDFSNSYRQDYLPYSNPNSFDVLNPQPFDPTPEFGFNDGSYGYNGGLVGSKQVYTGVKVHPSNIRGYSGPNPDGLEGFSITNESGVTYHFGLPAYNWGEENYQERIEKDPSGLTGVPPYVKAFNREKRQAAYAYTWYLTSITGPDFVDRNGSGTADNADWGYWVNFAYGKWSSDYSWRNPSHNYRRDQDNEWQNCSMGHKEVYYLNSVRTRSHIAIFEKDLRLDGKGESPESFGKNSNSITPETDYDNNGIINANSSQSLMLSKIYLLDASDANIVSPISGTGTYWNPNRSISVPGAEHTINVLDKRDIDWVGRSMVEKRALRRIDFNYDYSLCAGTINSFDAFSNPPGTTFINYSGKLTLKSIKMLGKAGVDMLPPTTFDYELSAEDIKSGNISVAPTSNQREYTFTSSVPFEVGDIINISTANENPWVITGNTSNTFNIHPVRNYELERVPQFGGYNNIATTTKNPAYNENAYDAWGCYKSDFSPEITKTNENLGRQTSPISAKNVDVWSLRRITTAVGSTVKINYESDRYRSVLNDNGTLLMDYITHTNEPAATAKIVIALNQDAYYEATSNLSIGDEIDFLDLIEAEDILPQGIRYIPVDSREVYSTRPKITGFDNTNRYIITDALHIPFFQHANIDPGVPPGLATTATIRGNLFTHKALKKYGGGGYE